ncbi:MAG TPA: serine protease, partial [Isosphaeraceae bacterium]
LGFLDVARWRQELFRLEGRVCRVELNDAGGTMGTGFLVGPDALLTNYHVLETVIEGRHAAAAVRFRFDYKTLPDGTPADGVLAALAAPEGRDGWLLGHGRYSAAAGAGTPDAAPPAADELDFALVRLDRALGAEPLGPDGTARGWVAVPAVQPAIVGIPALMILQHPARAPLKLAFDTRPQAELRHGGLRVRYLTNTEGGSSGSPCFDKDWTLVALHHYGDPAFSQPKYNQGVPIGLIRDHLDGRGRAALGGRHL